jgi:hypothetical protein
MTTLGGWRTLGFCNLNLSMKVGAHPSAFSAEGWDNTKVHSELLLV